MSVQFGRWNIDGQPVDPCYLQKTKGMLAPYGPDGGGVYIKDGVGILYRAFHTTKESRKESQPLVTPTGLVLCWDGRLDNREELIRDLGEPLTSGATDLDIVSTAYEARGTGCFAKFIGDWALSIWEPKTRSVVLAKDPIGTRHLYYSFDKDQITWSSILDPLVLLAEKSFALEEEYIAGWLSFFPATHLTPYVGIHAAPPSCFVRLVPGRLTTEKYWDFDPSKRILYRTDGEYEEHFRQVFGEAIRRRLRSDSPVLAELSGGMDSSSIVCMADAAIARGGGETPRLDTVSYFDDSEPNWNERPYVNKVEEKRGRTGCHVDASSQEPLTVASEQFAGTPGRVSCLQKKEQLTAYMKTNANRVLLSGVGGDEVLGGVPTPVPELADLIAAARLGKLARQLKVWALNKRKPWFYLLYAAARDFLPPRRFIAPIWVVKSFAVRNRIALQGYERRLRLTGGLPSFQCQMRSLNTLRRQLACTALSSEPVFDTNYPYLDRTLLEFLGAIPREQLIRPGQRRSLMRRSLVGIVPDEILTRRRKAFAGRSPRMAIACEWQKLESQSLVSATVGVIHEPLFRAALDLTRGMQPVAVVPILRALAVERWFKNLIHWHVLNLHDCSSRLKTRNEVGKALCSWRRSFLSWE